MDVANAVFPKMEQAAAFFGSAEDGPFVMVNLLKFKPHAEYEDGSDTGLSGREAYARYGAAVQACLAAVGGRSIYAGRATGLLLGEVQGQVERVGPGDHTFSIKLLVDSTTPYWLESAELHLLQRERSNENRRRL